MKKIETFWQKNILNKVIVIFTGLLFTSMMGGFFSDTQVNTAENKSFQTKSIVDTCDGINVTKNCEFDGVVYEKYIFHPAKEEKFHYETKTTSERKIIGYCTLCNDGTRSPSCSTGRGTCSYHGGVAEWNAPIYEDVEKVENIKIVDSEYTKEWYEKILKTSKSN